MINNEKTLKKNEFRKGCYVRFEKLVNDEVDELKKDSFADCIEDWFEIIDQAIQSTRLPKIIECGSGKTLKDCLPKEGKKFDAAVECLHKARDAVFMARFLHIYNYNVGNGNDKKKKLIFLFFGSGGGGSGM